MKKQLDLKNLTNKNDDNTYIINEAESPQSDEISLKAIEQLISIENLKSTSRLKFEQVAILSKLTLFAEVFGNNFTKKLADLIMEMQISTNGLGRKELVQLVQRRDGIELAPNGKPIQSKDIFR
jgi:hypothetical protein